MELALLRQMEKTLTQKRAVLEDMKSKKDPKVCEMECRVIGYNNAVDDLRIGIEAAHDKMAVDYGEMPVIFGRDGKRMDVRPLCELLGNDKG